MESGFVMSHTKQQGSVMVAIALYPIDRIHFYRGDVSDGLYCGIG